MTDSQGFNGVTNAFFQEIELGDSYPPFSAFREYFGFVPSLFRCQSLLPRLIEVEAGLAAAIHFPDRALSCRQKERLLLTLAAAHRNAYWVAAHYQLLCLLGEPEERLDQLVSDYRQTDLSPADIALLEFALNLGTNGPCTTRKDVEDVQSHGWSNAIILETILITAWSGLLSCLATGLGASPEFEVAPIPSTAQLTPQPGGVDPVGERAGPYLDAPDLQINPFGPFEFFHEHLGFVPNILRAQSARPDLIEAETEAFRLVVLAEDHLSHLQKELILLAVSAASRNARCVALHSEILRTVGVLPDVAEEIAREHRSAGLAEADEALLDFALKLASEPSEFGAGDFAPLRIHGFTDEQVLEAVVVTSFTHFLNTLEFGLGAEADFVPRWESQPVSEKVLNLPVPDVRHTGQGFAGDPDSETVVRVQNGDLDAFEDLINRHSRRVYRTLLATLGNQEEAKDAMQDTFLKAFQHLGDFQGRSRFSTWLVSIASNTGLQLLRERKRVQSLDDDGVETDEGFRPRQIRAWSDNPEQLCSKAELRALVEEHVMKLPVKYRVVVVLRDIEQVSIEEAAVALGLGIQALKSRHLRGRLMLREALTPHFAASAAGGAA